MKYGHVGRPTNEEVARKKKLKMIKIGVPIVLILIVILVLVSNNGLNGIMGNAVFDSENCKCAEGWQVADNNTCYQEITEGPYLVGDVINEQGELNPDGKVTLQDFEVVKKAIENSQQLDNIQKIIYDLNVDGLVNKEDLEAYSVDTNGMVLYDSTKWCTGEKDETTKGNNNETITTTVQYERSESDKRLCTANIIIKTVQPAVCNDEDQQNDTLSEVDLNTTPIESSQDEEINNNIEKGPIQVQTTTCDDEGKCYDSVEKYATDSNSMEIEDEALEPEQDIYEEELEEDDFSLINKTSNYYNYGDPNDNVESKIKIYTKNKNNTGGGEEYISIAPDSAQYKLYGSEQDCQIDIDGSIVEDNKNSSIWNLTVKKKNYKVKASNLFVEATISNVPENSILWIKQIKSPDGYKSNNECKRFIVGQDTKVEFINEPEENNHYYYLKINNKIIGEEDNQAVLNKDTGKKVKIYSTDNIVVNNEISVNNDYTFVGWAMKSDGKYLCYKEDRRNTTWSDECTYGKVILRTKGNLGKKIKDKIEKDGTVITLVSEWKIKNKMQVELKSTSKAPYKRHATVRLYNDKSQCLTDLKNQKYTKYTKTETKKVLYGWVSKKYQFSKNMKKNTGIITFNRNMISSKKYYLLVSPSTGYYDIANKDNCIEVSYKTKSKKVELKPKKFRVNFKTEKGTVNLHSFTKTVDVDFTKPISKSYGTWTGHVLTYFSASRKNQNKTEYRCYVGNNAGWHQKNECSKDVNGKTKYVKYGTNKNLFTLKINGINGDDITLTAHWELAKYNVYFNANGGSVSPKSKIVTYSKTYGTLPNPVRRGYTFKGWYNGNGQRIINNSKVTILSNTTLNAKWEAKKFKVTFRNVNGKAMKRITVTYDKKYSGVPGDNKIDYDHKALSFKGWYTRNKVQIKSGNVVKITQDIDAYATFDKVKYTIQLNLGNGGINKLSGYEYNDYVKIPNTSKPYYRLKNWKYISENKEEKYINVYNNVSGFYVKGDMIHSGSNTIVLYAIWSKYTCADLDYGTLEDPQVTKGTVVKSMGKYKCLYEVPSSCSYNKTSGLKGYYCGGNIGSQKYESEKECKKNCTYPIYRDPQY